MAAEDEAPAAGKAEAVGVEIGDVAEGVFLGPDWIGFAGPVENAAGAEADDSNEFGVTAGVVTGGEVDAKGEVANLAADGLEEAGREDAGGHLLGHLADGGEVLRVGLPAGFFGVLGQAACPRQSRPG